MDLIKEKEKRSFSTPNVTANVNYDCVSACVYACVCVPRVKTWIETRIVEFKRSLVKNGLSHSVRIKSSSRILPMDDSVCLLLSDTRSTHSRPGIKNWSDIDFRFQRNPKWFFLRKYSSWRDGEWKNSLLKWSWMC